MTRWLEKHTGMEEVVRAGQLRVMEAFANGEKKTESAFKTDGIDVLSYNMLIAHRCLNGKVLYLLPPASGGPAVSSSTSAHLGACSWFCEQSLKSLKCNRQAVKDEATFLAAVGRDRKARAGAKESRESRSVSASHAEVKEASSTRTRSLRRRWAFPNACYYGGAGSETGFSVECSVCHGSILAGSILRVMTSEDIAHESCYQDALVHVAKANRREKT